MEHYPQRRRNRLPFVQYNENGAYFITICTREKANLFWSVGAANRRLPECLSPVGRMVDEKIHMIDAIYADAIHVDHYVIMPNHVHLLLRIAPDGRRLAAPTVSVVVNQFKGAVSKAAGFSCWQKSFHDHIIRGEADYRRIWEYIDANPGKWEEDCYYIQDE